MTFSNVGSFNSTYKALSATNIAKESSNVIKKGGAFSPNFAETTSIMRASLDNQWENAYIIKYQALMQNRLNSLKQELTAAYNNLLQQATSQQIRENGSNNAISATTDVYGRMLPGTNSTFNSAFKGLKYYDDKAALDAADAKGKWDGSTGPLTEADGIPSYYIGANDATNPAATNTYQYNAVTGALQNQKAENYEMRKLYVSGPAMQIANDMKVTFRSEEVLPKGVAGPGGILGLLDPLMPEQPNPAFKAGQKVAEYSTEVKTGGFWSTINYLYDFSPRELKYAYATSYSTTTEESGTRNDASGKQTTLYSGKITDARDMQGDNAIQTNEDGNSPNLTGNTPGVGENNPYFGTRVKWTTSNPEDGYLTEMNTTSNINNTMDQMKAKWKFPTSPDWNTSSTLGKDNREITRRTSDNDNNFPYLATKFNSFGDQIKGTGANLWTGYVVGDNPIAPTDQREATMKVSGTEEGGITDITSRLKWEYQHDGIGGMDTNRDSEINSSDTHIATAAFINHYQVAVQQVELNSNPDSYGKVLALGHTRDTNINDMANSTLNPYDTAVDPMNAVASKILRSGGIDASIEHVFSDVDNIYDSQGKLIHQENVQADGTGQDKNEKMMLPGSGKIAKNFTPAYVEGLHQINSFNGQSLGANGGNVTISSETANSTPVILGEYEGFKRAQTMSIGLAHDTYNDFAKQATSYQSALDLKKKLEAEINASSMVDTDWHYAEYASSTGGAALDGIMFRNIKKVSYSDPDKGIGELNIYYNRAITDDPNGNTHLYVDPATGLQGAIQGTADDTFDNVNIAFRKVFNLTRDQFQTLEYKQVNPIASNPVAGISPDAYVNSPSYKSRSVNIDVNTQNVDMDTLDLVVNGNIVSATATNKPGGTATYDIASFLQEGDNVIAFQMKVDKTVANIRGKAVMGGTGTNDYFKLGSTSTNDTDISSWISSKISTTQSLTGDAGSTELTSSINTGVNLSSWQSKIMANEVRPSLYAGIYPSTLTGGVDPVKFYVNEKTGQITGNPADIPMTEQAYNAYGEALMGLGSTKTVTKIKDSNTFLKVLMEAMNKKEYQDIFALGLLSSSLGKDMIIKGNVASPSGGNIQSTLNIKYDNINNKFILVQTKWDASGAPQQS